MNRRLALLPALAAAALLAACSSTSSSSPSSSSPSAVGSSEPATTASAPSSAAASASAGGDCPVAPIPVVVSVDQWGDIVSQLGGACADVTTVIKSSSVDPHDYEPTAADIAAFSGAKLVVVNGADYDHWAEQAVASTGGSPTVVSAAAVNNVADGANPHLWYSPDYVFATAAAVTDALKTVDPSAASYFDQQASAWDASMAPYRDTIARIASEHTGATYVATESIFDYMAQALGMVNKTPQGYQNAAAAESDPAPGDVFDFQKALESGSADVLIYNTQTEGSIPEQLRQSAETASVPVVDVTETVAPGFDTFEAWQVSQLDALEKALATS
ncbi:MAG: zinc ABC transporter substrate-binding protein [Candidatus Nanopelagicales bacterium]